MWRVIRLYGPVPVTRMGGEDRMGSSLTEPPGLLDTGHCLRGSTGCHKHRAVVTRAEQRRALIMIVYSEEDGVVNHFLSFLTLSSTPLGFKS